MATHLPIVVQANGSAEQPLQHVRLENITIAHSRSTFMDRHEQPSGGDWSIVRSGALFIDGAKNIAIRRARFDQVDGNGAFLSRFARNCSITDSDFLRIGATAIAAVGASSRGMIDNSQNWEYPAYNVIRGNHVHTVGVWVKQSAAYFKALTRSNIIVDNVFHDGPRSGINLNDGFAGGDRLSGNLLFNYVKESNDHGPVNAWDRQPFVYRLDEDNSSSELAISPQTTFFNANLIINFNYHGASCGSIAIDFDDETSQMDVAGNVLVFGAVKTFDGMDRSVSNNLILYAHNANRMATSCCLAALQSTRNVSSAHTHFFNNTCVLPADSNALYECGAGPGPFANRSYRVHTHSNRFFFPDQSELPANEELWGGCNLWGGSPKHEEGPRNWSQWQAAGLDAGSTLSLTLSDAAMIAHARSLLGL